MQPSVKVGGHNAARFIRFLDAFFVLFEQFQSEFQVEVHCSVIGARNHANLAKFGHCYAQHIQNFGHVVHGDGFIHQIQMPQNARTSVHKHVGVIGHARVRFAFQHHLRAQSVCLAGSHDVIHSERLQQQFHAVKICIPQANESAPQRIQ